MTPTYPKSGYRTSPPTGIVPEGESPQVRLRNVITEGPAILYACEPAGEYACTLLTDNVTPVLGYESSEFLEDPRFWTDRIHAEDRPQVLADLHRLPERGVHIHEYRFRHKNGTYRWIHDHLHLVRDEAGKPLEIVGYLVDCTDRKAAEAEERQTTRETIRADEQHRAELRFGALLDTTPDAIVAARRDGTIEFINKQTEAMFGYERNELLGRTVETLVPDSMRLAHRQHRTDYLEQPSERVMGVGPVLAGRRKDGTEFPAYITLTPIMSAGDLLIVAVIREA